ncbi:hypothetical protein [Streptacidiphilus sp. P02-A3a]|uniref:hypothetical protein n=1 Tax=Streptacidiphilus sp. P02-A3a TaxID=2704468 RepID=UPI0015F7AA83|nr:hypothetical protein [Streptacidiphilus sp. P02-A3a]QMU68661.1 hypothetical protein GXP74_10875 [Streptacidiphilus sp. P02-A3a]
MDIDAGTSVVGRPWTLTLEVVQLEGPEFDLERHRRVVEELIIRDVCDMVFRLEDGAVIRIESYLGRRDPVLALEGRP